MYLYFDSNCVAENGILDVHNILGIQATKRVHHYTDAAVDDKDGLLASR